MREQTVQLIGASLSEPHTSMTALHNCVCMLLAWVTYCKLAQYSNISNHMSTMVLQPRSENKSEGLLLDSNVNVRDPEQRRLKLNGFVERTGSDKFICYESDSHAGDGQAVRWQNYAKCTLVKFASGKCEQQAKPLIHSRASSASSRLEHT